MSSNLRYLKSLYIETTIFLKYELDKAVNSIKIEGILDEILIVISKNKQFCIEVYEKNPISIWNNGCIIFVIHKGDQTSTNNYRVITLACVAAKIYNMMLLNSIRPGIDNLLRKIKRGLVKINPLLDNFSRLEELLNV